MPYRRAQIATRDAFARIVFKTKKEHSLFRGLCSMLVSYCQELKLELPDNIASLRFLFASLIN